jgi:hypothetical protein
MGDPALSEIAFSISRGPVRCFKSYLMGFQSNLEFQTRKNVWTVFLQTLHEFKEKINFPSSAVKELKR